MSAVLIVSRTTALTEALGRTMGAGASLSSLEGFTTALGEGDWSIVVGILPRPERMVEGAQSVLDDLESICSASLTECASVRRLAVVNFVPRADDLAGSEACLSDRVRRRVHRATADDEEQGLGVTLIRYVYDEDTGDPQWPDDVADVLRFIDTSAPYVAVPEIELAR
jgi:hypothetical protein